MQIVGNVNSSLLRHSGFPSGSDGKESACNARDRGSIPGLERFPGEGNGYPLQYSCLENSIDREAWLAIVHVVFGGSGGQWKAGEVQEEWSSLWRLGSGLVLWAKGLNTDKMGCF